MNKTAVMKDPFYVPILFNIEKTIAKCDSAATAAGTSVNDSQIRSTLTKVRKTAQGGTPNIPNSSEREKILAKLHQILSNSRADFSINITDPDNNPLPLTDWLLCLETVEESIQRRSTGPGSRAYLDFIPLFLNQK